MRKNGATGRVCPVCGRFALEEFQPFCSRHCADVDLGRWLTGQYRIPGPADEPDEPDEDSEPA